MKTTRIILCLLSATALSLSSLTAQDAGPPQGGPRGSGGPGGEFQRPMGGKPGDKAGKSREAQMLEHLLELDDAQLSQLRQTIERIEKMSPDERSALSKRLKKMQNMDPKRVDEMRKRYEEIPKEKREAMRQRWLDMSPEERKEWRDKLRNMPHEERQAILEENGFLPMPHHGKPRRGPKGDRAGEMRGPRLRGPEGGPPPPPPPPEDGLITEE